MESLNLVLVVGLAVDYCVHLAENYCRSPCISRLDRVQDTLEHTALSVLAGGVTTLGASTFLLFAEIRFFFQFGAFIYCTIGLSIFYALGFFLTILGIIGPDGETGSVRCLWKRKGSINRTCDVPRVHYKSQALNNAGNEGGNYFQIPQSTTYLATTAEENNYYVEKSLFGAPEGNEKLSDGSAGELSVHVPGDSSPASRNNEMLQNTQSSDESEKLEKNDRNNLLISENRNTEDVDSVVQKKEPSI